MPLIRRLCDDIGLQQLYIADLDAIQHRGSNRSLLIQIAQTFPHLTLWIDAGFSSPSTLQDLQTELSFRPVIGSETWQHTRPFTCEQAILSIDSVNELLRDPSGITTDESRRPDTLILMNLDRVGSQAGPDTKLLSHWKTVAPDAALYMAGGVRGRDDLVALQAAGAEGVLLASALHSGALTVKELKLFS